jgi:hypothetical protein
MGILSGKDLLSPKFTTAIISDSSNRIFFIPIKYTMGDYFLAKIEHQTYVFKMDGSRLKTYRDTAVRTFRAYFFDTSHYKPIGDEAKELELVLELNQLPRVESTLFSVFKMLGKKDKHPFEPHKITDLKEYINKKKQKGEEADEYVRQAKGILNYLDHLGTQEIVTPLKRVSEFIEDDLITTDPKFLGSILTAYEEVDMEHKKITNTPIKSSIAWIKFLAIMMGIGLVGAVLYMAYEQGAFDSLAGIGAIGDINFNLTPPSSSTDIMTKYPTPESLRGAVDSGEVDYNSLPPDVKKLVDGVESPRVVDIP